MTPSRGSDHGVEVGAGVGEGANVGLGVGGALGGGGGASGESDSTEWILGWGWCCAVIVAEGVRPSVSEAEATGFMSVGQSVSEVDLETS
jgi:hypothetical protein